MIGSSWGALSQITRWVGGGGGANDRQEGGRSYQPDHKVDGYGVMGSSQLEGG